MKRFSILSLGIVAILSLVIACNKNDNYCPFVAPGFVAVNFTENDYDTIIIRRFEKDNSFSKLVDTILMSKAEMTYKTIGQDSVLITSINPKFRLFNEEIFANDWQFYIPGAQVTESISEVKGLYETQAKPTQPCKSYVQSMKYQGSIRTYTTWLSDSYRFYITKK